ncbi:MAG: sulfatase [Chloroflexi bacterium]|nr:sulfatase [Chloroflexota bacterium]
MTVKQNIQPFAKETLSLSAAMGLLTGLVEGLLLFSLSRAALLTWRLQNRAYWYETLWIAPLVDVILFTLAGAVFALAGWFLPRLPIRKVAWFAFIFLAAFDWLFIVLFGKISLFAILLLAAGTAYQIFSFISKREAAATRQLTRILRWLAGATIAILILNQGGGWLNEKIRTARLPAAAPNAPNVIVIIVDTLRADHLSSYGYKRNTSPFIDNLAVEGVRFETAIAPSSWTQPSHASMLTGRYTYETHAETQPLDDTYPTIGEVMQANGYRTAAFSANTLFFTRRQGHGRGFLHFEDNYQSVTDAFFNSSLYGFLFDFYGLRKALDYEGVPNRLLASDINAAALNWIDKGGEPFFVFMNYFDVHDPYTPPEPYRSQFASIPSPGGLINGFMERYSPSLTPEQIQSEVDAYDGSIAYVDDQIKALFGELEARGLLENTVVIVTSDHGESFGEHDGILQHSASLYLDEIHVPLIVWAPGQVPAGKTVGTPVTITALPSTILSLINAADDPFPGPSLAILISGEAPADWPDPISELAQMNGAAEVNPSTHGAIKSVVGDEMQYIHHEKFGEELYNWIEDPQEMNNLVNEPSARTALNGFRLYLKTLLGEIFRIP